MLTSNITILVVSLGVLLAVIFNLHAFSIWKADPPSGNAEDLSLNDMLARLTEVEVDPISANAIAMAKKRAYEKKVAEEKKAKARADWYAKNRKKIEASNSARALARINPSTKQNKAHGKQMNELRGWSRCWDALETLWDHESNWNERAENPSSGAYGIPQSLPGSKMATAGSDWRTSSPTQIAWGLGYIKARYKDPCGAWAFWQSHNWY